MTASSIKIKGTPSFKPSGLFSIGFVAGLAGGCMLLLFVA